MRATTSQQVTIASRALQYQSQWDPGHRALRIERVGHAVKISGTLKPIVGQSAAVRELFGLLAWMIPTKPMSVTVPTSDPDVFYTLSLSLIRLTGRASSALPAGTTIPIDITYETHAPMQ